MTQQSVPRWPGGESSRDNACVHPKLCHPGPPRVDASHPGLCSKGPSWPCELPGGIQDRNAQAVPSGLVWSHPRSPVCILPTGVPWWKDAHPEHQGLCSSTCGHDTVKVAQMVACVLGCGTGFIAVAQCTRLLILFIFFLIRSLFLRQ